MHNDNDRRTMSGQSTAALLQDPKMRSFTVAAKPSLMMALSILKSAIVLLFISLPASHGSDAVIPAMMQARATTEAKLSPSLHNLNFNAHCSETNKSTACNTPLEFRPDRVLGGVRCMWMRAEVGMHGPASYIYLLV
jgi:hypothetical protein